MKVFSEPLRTNGRGYSNPGISWVEKWVDREIYLDALGENKNLLPPPSSTGTRRDDHGIVVRFLAEAIIVCVYARSHTGNQERKWAQVGRFPKLYI